jgi:hypothetical protein
MNVRKLTSLVLVLWLLGASSPSAVHAAGPVAGSVQRAISWLHTQQLPDGSFGLRRLDGSYTSSASITADVIYVLTLAGEDPAGSTWSRGGQSALDALAKLAPGYVYSDAGQAGKVARAVALAGGNPRSFGGLNLVGIIQAAYDPVSGRYHPSLLYRHTLAVEGLLRTGEPVPPAALNALLQAQLRDGSWFWSFEATQGDVDTTGRVVQLLATQTGVQTAAALARSASYLSMQQATTGGWGVGYLPGPPNANSTALAVAGLRAAGYDPQTPCFRKAGSGALETLLSYQESSGAFVYVLQPGKEESRLMATVDVLNALVQPLARPATNGLAECRSSSRWLELTTGRRDTPGQFKGLRCE